MERRFGGIDMLDNRQIGVVMDCGKLTRDYLIKKYGGADNLMGKCKEAADLMIKALGSRAIKASKHFGWCLYDNCNGCSGEPCDPHCYVLIHDGNKRWYLDCTATQFQFALDQAVPEVILLQPGARPYWFREKKPSLREMEEISGY